ncbi:MAG TPA: PKD domain-containing protein [Phycisphaerae bacterium]|nr:PKD domain-containing protein [Phycisphaerae bacterium]
MTRVTTICLFGCLTMLFGLSGETCDSPGNSFLDDLRGPPAIIATSPGEGVASRTLEVDLRQFPETDRISWEFGDGGMARDLPVDAGRRVSHTFSGNGTFTVSVHLFSGADPIRAEPAKLIATGRLPIDILGPNQKPIATFTVEDAASDSGVEGITRRFNAASSRDPDGTIEEFRWDFGDGGQALGRTVNHTYAVGGTYTVRLTVKDNRGERVFTQRTIFVNAAPNAEFTFEVDESDTLLLSFDGSGSSDVDGEIERFDWDFGDGETLSDGGPAVEHAYAAPGTFTVQLEVFDEQGVSDSATIDVVVTTEELLVTSISERYGEVETTIDALEIDGVNFDQGATVRLERGATQLSATQVDVRSETQITADFDLSAAELGDYDIVVENPDDTTDRLDDAFRVVTPNLVRLETSMGDIVFELVDDAPVTTDNFLQYVEDGFYDGTIFHRIVPDFVVQGGGFLPGMIPPDGLRDPIVNEFDVDRSNLRATVAMAKLGGDPDSATSQFFVNLDDNSENLDNQNGGFTVFAHVIEGMDVVDAISEVPLNGEEPEEDVTVMRAERE